MSSPLVSIIIPVFNAEKFIRDTLHSVLLQTYSNIEMVCVDDGSSDSSFKILREMSEKFAKISTYKKENGGVSDARNFGLAKAKGEYLLFLDSDDVIREDTIEEAVKYIEEQNSDAVLFNMETLLPTGQRFVCFGQDFFKTDLLSINALNYAPSFNFTNAAPVLFRTKFLKENNLNFVKGMIYEDWIFMVSFFLKKPKITLLNKVFYTYRIQENGGSNITNNISEACLDIFSAYKLSKAKIKLLHNNSEVVFINDEKILKESVSFLLTRLLNCVGSEVAEEYIRNIYVIASSFESLYLDSLIQRFSFEEKSIIYLILKKRIHTKWEILLEIRKKYFFSSLLSVYRGCRDSIKNLLLIIVLFLK